MVSLCAVLNSEQSSQSYGTKTTSHLHVNFSLISNTFTLHASGTTLPNKIVVSTAQQTSTPNNLPPARRLLASHIPYVHPTKTSPPEFILVARERAPRKLITPISRQASSRTIVTMSSINTSGTSRILFLPATADPCADPAHEEAAALGEAMEAFSKAFEHLNQHLDNSPASGRACPRDQLPHNNNNDDDDDDGYTRELVYLIGQLKFAQKRLEKKADAVHDDRSNHCGPFKLPKLKGERALQLPVVDDNTMKALAEELRRAGMDDAAISDHELRLRLFIHKFDHRIQLPKALVLTDLSRPGQRVVSALYSMQGVAAMAQLMLDGRTQSNAPPLPLPAPTGDITGSWRSRVLHVAKQLQSQISTGNIAVMRERFCQVGLYRALKAIRPEGMRRNRHCDIHEIAAQTGCSHPQLFVHDRMGKKLHAICGGHLGLVPLLPLGANEFGMEWKNDILNLPDQDASSIGKTTDSIWHRRLCRLGYYLIHLTMDNCRDDTPLDGVAMRGGELDTMENDVFIELLDALGVGECECAK